MIFFDTILGEGKWQAIDARWPYMAKLAYDLSGNADWEKTQDAILSDESLFSKVKAMIGLILEGNENLQQEGLPINIPGKGEFYLWVSGRDYHPKPSSFYTVTIYLMVSVEADVMPELATGATLVHCRLGHKNFDHEES